MRRVEKFRRSAGFTLIELLVVIAIIGLLIGLLIPAVMKFRAKGPELRTRSEIGQLGQAIESYKTTYGDIKAPPTCMWLSSDYAQYTPAQSPALAESRSYYAKVWPKAFIPGQPGKTPLPGNLPSPYAGAVFNAPMDGNQLLVFLLGGIPPNGAPLPASPFYGNRTGFLNSPTNPFNYQGQAAGLPAAQYGWYPAGGQNAKGPFFDFDPKRIDSSGHFHDPFWASNDPNKINNNIYYYFAARNGNDYNAFGSIYANPADPMAISGITAAGGYGGGLNVDPCIGIDLKYLNFDGYQIISAGADGVPGPGGAYQPGLGFYAQGLDRVAGTRGGGFDDQSNFRTRLMGAANDQ